MFTKILFATTASPTCDNAAKMAFDLQSKWDTQLFVFHVFGIPTHGFSSFVADVNTGQKRPADPDYFERVREEIRHLYADLLQDSQNVIIETAIGTPHREILRLARKENVDLIIMGGPAQDEDRPADRYRDVAGSTMQKVAKASRCPVVIVSRPCTTCRKLFSNIVYGTDFSKAADYAFLWSYDLAKEVDARLHLFHAVDTSSASAERETIEARIAKARAEIETRYISRIPDFDAYDIEIWEGRPYVEILKFAHAKQADLIVLAHHARESDPDKALLGSTVEQVVLRAACPVASVNRPRKVAALED